MSGQGLVGSGLSSLASAGLSYFMDPQHGAERRRKVWKQAKALWRDAEGVGDSVSSELRHEGAELRRFVGQARRLLRGRSASAAWPLAAVGVGLSVGAGLMYFLDPKAGPDRRKQLQDGLLRLRGVAEDAAARVRQTAVHGATDVPPANAVIPTAPPTN